MALIRNLGLTCGFVASVIVAFVVGYSHPPCAVCFSLFSLTHFPARNFFYINSLLVTAHYEWTLCFVVKLCVISEPKLDA